MILVATSVLMLGAMAFVWSNVRIVKLAYEFQGLVQERRQLLRENRLLKVEMESLRSLDRVQALARKQIGLRTPENRQMVTVFLK